MIRNAWMYFFFATLLLCAFMAVVLYLNAASDNKRCEDLKRSDEGSYKKRYEDLKTSYIELAGTESSSLTQMMLKPDALKEYYPRYKDLKDDELAKTVRKDIGRLEVKVEDLEKQK